MPETLGWEASGDGVAANGVSSVCDWVAVLSDCDWFADRGDREIGKVGRGDAVLAMHIPDGFIDGPTSLVAGLVAIAVVAWALRMTKRGLDDREVPIVGLVAAFVFAAQMINFPVANGTSGHLLGAVLAAVLVGPYAGALAVTVVLIVQALLFADGGLSALGLNVVNMALVGAFGGYAVFLLVRRLAGRSTASVATAAGVAAFTAPVLAAIAFTLEYAVGGNDAVSVRAVAASMIGVHVLIGIGEGLITAVAVGAVMATRPDLVHGARTVVRPSEPVGAPAAVS
jgi:cobalt/nickel transport system permease protein